MVSTYYQKDRSQVVDSRWPLKKTGKLNINADNNELALAA